MQQEIQYKTCVSHLTPFKVTNQNAQTGYFQGYASSFDTIDSQGDKVVRGAFQQSIDHWKKHNKMPAMLWQHNQEKIIGSWINIKEDNYGLHVEGKLLLNITQGQEAYTLIKEKLLDGLSIGYKVQNAMKSSNPSHIRLLTQVELIEISLVTFPANRAARIIDIKQT